MLLLFLKYSYTLTNLLFHVIFFIYLLYLCDRMSNIECKISTDKSSQRKEQNNDFKYNKKRPTNRLQPRKKELSIAIKSVLVLIDKEKDTLRFFFISLEKELNVRLTKGTWKKAEKKLEKLVWHKYKKDIEFPTIIHKHLRDKEKDIVSKKA